MATTIQKFHASAIHAMRSDETEEMTYCGVQPNQLSVNPNVTSYARGQMFVPHRVNTCAPCSQALSEEEEAALATSTGAESDSTRLYAAMGKTIGVAAATDYAHGFPTESAMKEDLISRVDALIDNAGIEEIRITVPYSEHPFRQVFWDAVWAGAKEIVDIV